MTTPVTSPYQVFTDLGGDPLEGGQIYVGIANQDPVSSPKQVYWDAAHTIPAAQPLRTVGGYIVRGNSPALPYVDGQYSIIVNNRNGTRVLYAGEGFPLLDVFVTAASLAAPTGAAGVGKAGGGTVQDFIDDISDVYLTKYCTGSGNEATQIQAAVNAAEGRRLIVNAHVSTASTISGVDDIRIIDGGGSITNIDPTVDDDITIFQFIGKSDFEICDGVKLIGSGKTFSPDFSKGAGVYIYDCNNFKVNKSKFTNFTAQAVIVNSTVSNVTQIFEINGNVISDGNPNFGGGDIEILGAGTTKDWHACFNYCLSENGAGIGVTMGYATGGEIRNGMLCSNIIRSKTRHGIYTYGDAGQTVAPTAIKIHDNDVDGAGWIGIYISEQGKSISIEGNTTRNCGHTPVGSLPFGCIGAVSNAGGVVGRRLIILGNICDGWNGKSGVRVQGYIGPIVSTNSLTGDGVARVAADDNAITFINCQRPSAIDNTLELTGVEGTGIYNTNYVTDTTTAYKGAKIFLNHIYLPSNGGIYFKGNQTGGQNAGEVSSNYIDMGASSSIAIYLYNARGNKVQDNTIIGGTATVDIYLTADGAPGCSFNEIRRNTAIHTHSGKGIWVDSSDHVGNIVEDNNYKQAPNIGANDVVTDAGMGTQILRNMWGYDPLTGSFTFGASSSAVIANTNANIRSKIQLIAKNAAAAAMLGSGKCPYVGAYSEGTNITLLTADDDAATGGADFDYVLS